MTSSAEQVLANGEVLRLDLLLRPSMARVTMPCSIGAFFHAQPLHQARDAPDPKMRIRSSSSDR
jgi:hypothetical protein